MALSEIILFASTVVIFNVLSCHGASISRPSSNDLYSITPSEVLELKPYNYQQSRKLKYLKAVDELEQDDEVIYVKLLKLNYRPKNLKSVAEDEVPSKESTMRDIFYVKAPTNGKFSDQRLRVYYVPEFYAINVYKKSDMIS